MSRKVRCCSEPQLMDLEQTEGEVSQGAKRTGLLLEATNLNPTQLTMAIIKGQVLLYVGLLHIASTQLDPA